MTVGYTAVSALSGAVVAGTLGSQGGYAGKAALIGATILGLAGFLVGGMRALAVLLAARSRRDR